MISDMWHSSICRAFVINCEKYNDTKCHENATPYKNHVQSGNEIYIISL